MEILIRQDIQQTVRLQKQLVFIHLKILFYLVGSDDLFRHDNSPRPLTRLTDYINERPKFPQVYVPPSSIKNKFLILFPFL